MNSYRYKSINSVTKNEFFSNCDLNKNTTDGRLIAVNRKYLAFSCKNIGQIIIVNSGIPTKIDENNPRIKGVKSNILDLEFSPFNDNILSACYENKSILLWKIPENGLREDLKKESLIYNKHSKKVHFINFNPIFKDVICSAELSGEIHVWSPLKSEPYINLKADDTSASLLWNPSGVLIGATTKKKTINIFDPRNNKIAFEQKIKGLDAITKFDWIDDNLFVTINREQNNYKEYKFLKLWDIRKLSDKKIVNYVNLDNSSNISTPFVDRESKLLYITSKGGKNIDLYNYYEEKFEKKQCHSKDPSDLSILFDRRYLDKNNFEIDRFARYSDNKTNKIYYVSFSLDRKDSNKDLIIYPQSKETFLTYEQWISDKNINVSNIVEETNNKINEPKFNTDKFQKEKKDKKSIEKKVPLNEELKNYQKRYSFTKRNSNNENNFNQLNDKYIKLEN